MVENFENEIENKKTKTIKNKRQKTKIDKVFSIFYWALAFLLIISMIFDRFMPVSYTKNLVFFVLTLTFLELFLILMFTKVILISKNKKKRVLAFLCFIVNALILLLRIFIDFDILILIAFSYNTILGIYIIIDYFLYKTKKPNGKLFDKNFSIIIAIVLLIAMINTFNHSYVNENALLIYGLIPMGILLVTFIILSFTIFKKTYALMVKNIWTKIGIVFLAIVLSFGYGMTFIDVVNTSIKSTPQKVECVIVGKDVDSGYRQITRYKLYVLINDKKVTIDVSNDIYKLKKINDKITINYYKGNLNLAYYENGEEL